MHRDSFRERELADLDIKAEISSNGVDVYVFLSIDDFDELVRLAKDGSTAFGPDFSEGYDAGHADALDEVRAFAQGEVGA